MTTPAQPLYAILDDSQGALASAGGGSGKTLFQFSSPSLAQAQALATIVANLLNRSVRLAVLAGAPPWTQFPAALSPLGFATATGNLTASTATLATNSGAAFPVAAAASTTSPPVNGLVGCLMCVGPNASGVGAVAYGLITANTATTATVAAWTNPASATGAAQSNPNATSSYQIINFGLPAVAAGLSGISF
jgi:hypothetical protein